MEVSYFGLKNADVADGKIQSLDDREQNYG